MTEAPLLPGFKLDQTFFGFNPEDRVKLHGQLFDLLWVGEGRWDWDTLYSMPIHLRSFYIKKINKINHDRQDAQRKSIAKQKSTPRIAKPPM